MGGAIARLRVMLEGNDSSLQRASTRSQTAAARTTRAWKKASRDLNSAGRTMTRGVTTPILAAGAASVKAAVDFETSMSRMAGLAGVSEKQIGKFRKAVLRLAPDVGKSPKELADGLFFIASAGLKGKKALDALVYSARASAGGLGEVEVVADAVTSAVNSYAESNLTAKQATDILTAAVREGKLEASSLAPVIGRVAPMGAKLGVSFDQVGAALAVMSKGSGDAAQSATQLRGIFSKLIKPSRQAKEMLGKVGLTTKELRRIVGEQGLLPALTMLKTKFGDNTEALGKIFEDVEAVNGLFMLTEGNVKATSDTFKALATDTSASDVAFDAFSKTTQHKLNQSLAELQVAAIEVGDVLIPMVTKVVSKVGEWARAFSKLDPATQHTIMKVVGLVATIGPALIFISKLVTAVNILRLAMIRLAATRAGVALSSMLGAIGPLGLVLGVVGGAALIGAMRFGKYGEAVDAAKKKLDNLSDTLVKTDGAITRSVSKQVGAALATDGMAHKLTEAGLNAKLARDNILGLSDDLDQLEGSLRMVTTYGPEFVDSLKQQAANGNKLAQELLRINDRYLEMGGTSGDASVKTQLLGRDVLALRDKFKDEATTASEARRVMKQLGDETGKTGDATDRAERQLQRFGDTVRTALGVQLDARDSVIRYKDAVARLRESLAEHGVTWNLNTEAGRRNSEMLNSLIQSSVTAAEAEARGSNATDKAADAKRRLRRRLRELRAAFPEAAGQIDDFLGRLDNMKTKGQDAGDSVGRSMAQGVGSGFVNEFAGQIPVLVAQLTVAKRQAEKAIEAGSPSRAWARDVGGPMAAGVARGFAKGTKGIVRAVDRALRAAVQRYAAAKAPLQRAIDDLEGKVGDPDLGDKAKASARNRLSELRDELKAVERAERTELDRLRRLRQDARTTQTEINQIRKEARRNIREFRREIRESLVDLIQEVGPATARALASVRLKSPEQLAEVVSQLSSMGSSVESAMKSATSAVDHFGEEADVGASEFLDFLKESKRQTQAWRKGMDTLMAAGVSNTILEELMARGPEAQGVMNALLEAVASGQIDQINAVQQSIDNTIGTAVDHAGQYFAPIYAEMQKTNDAFARDLSKRLMRNGDGVADMVGDYVKKVTGRAADRIEKLLRRLRRRLNALTGAAGGQVSTQMLVGHARGAVIRGSTAGVVRRLGEGGPGQHEAVVPLGTGRRALSDRLRVMREAGLLADAQMQQLAGRATVVMSGGDTYDESIRVGEINVHRHDPPDAVLQDLAWARVTGRVRRRRRGRR